MAEAMQRQPNSASTAILPDELIVEILSLLPVKPLIKFRCVNKFFKTLISDPHFVQMHLSKSSRNSQLVLLDFKDRSWEHWNKIFTLSPPCLLQNQFTIFYPDNVSDTVVGSCNGLLLIVFRYFYSGKNWFYLWNPVMRTKSIKFRIFPDEFFMQCLCYKFSLGYDNSTQTYKVVGFYVEKEKQHGGHPKSVVKVFSLGDNSCRDIQCFPVLPLYCFEPINKNKNNGVHFNGTINWIAHSDYINSSVTFVDQYVILSLDLSTETYTQLLLPPGFDNKVSHYATKIIVLMDCLCFCHDDFEKTHFVIWQMKYFGVQDSWIQLLKISHQHFDQRSNLLPLYLSENRDTLILATIIENEAFVYNCRDCKVMKIRNSINTLWSQAKNFVESLVSTH